MSDAASQIRILVANASEPDYIAVGLQIVRIASHRSLLRRFKWHGYTIAAALVISLIFALLVPGRVHALDPNKRVRPPTTTTSGGIVAFLMAYSITPRSRSAASSNSLASNSRNAALEVHLTA